MNERDSHFAGFAKLLWQEINDKGKFNIDMEAPDTDEIVTRLIARRAYDLARHIIWETMGGTPNAITIILADVPDLTAWPEKDNEQ